MRRIEGFIVIHFSKVALLEWSIYLSRSRELLIVNGGVNSHFYYAQKPLDDEARY